MSTTTAFKSRYPTKPLKFLARLRAEKVENVPTEGVYIGLEQIESYTGRLTGLDPEQQPEGSANVFQTGDVLFGKLRPYLAKGWVANRAGFSTTECLVLTPEQCEPRFLRYCLLSSENISAVDGSTYGSKMPRADWRFIGSVQFPAPVPSQQGRIANFLDEQTARIDALISEKERLLAKLAEYAAAHANELLRDRLNSRGAVRLKYRCPDVTVGIVVTPAKYYVDRGVPCLRSLNVGQGYLAADNLVYISPEANELHSKSKIFAGDIVVVRSGKTGSAAVVTPEFDGANCIDLVIIRSSAQVVPEWLRVYLNSAPALEQITDASEGAIQQHFNVSSARQLRIPDCAPEEQRTDLAEVLRVEQATSNLRNHVEEHIARLREYRSSMISAAVTGELDVGRIKRGNSLVAVS